MDIYELIAVLLQAANNGATSVRINFDGNFWDLSRPEPYERLVDEALVLQVGAWHSSM